MHPHRLDALSLVTGLLFVAIGGATLLGSSALGWLAILRVWPVLMVAAGVAVLIRILRSPREP